MLKNLRYFCTLLLMAVVGVAWAQTTHTIGWGTASGDAGTFTNFTETSGEVSGVLSFTTAKNDAGSAPAYNANSSELRLYYNAGGNGGSITITPADGITITDAVITTSTSPAVAYYVDGGSATSVTGSGNTYTISNISASSSLEIKNVNTSNTQLRIKTIAITYTSGGSSSVATTTTIDASGITNTDVYTSTDAGTLTATVTETESGDAVSGATVTWTSSKEDVATIDEDGVVTLVAAGTTTITANYAGVSGEFGSSSDTYELTVTSSAPYEQPTTIEITPNYEFWGQTAQFSGSTYSELSGEKDNVTLEWTRGTGSTYANTTAMRFYKDNTLNFTAPDGYEIKSIEFTYSQTQSDLEFSPGGYNSESNTWTGSSANVTMSRPSSGSSYYQITQITITLGEPSTDPTIDADNVNIAYDAIEGEIPYTINNPVPGTLLQATADADWISNITVGESAITFNATANEANTERVATFTLTYEGAEDKTVTVTQAAAPMVYTTIPDLFAAATATSTPVTITFNNWVISAVNGSNAYLTDNAGNGLIIYKSNHGFNVNDVLSGTASCNLVLYRGSAELTDLTATTDGLTVTADGTVTEQNIAINTLGGVNTGALLHFDGLTFDGDNLVDADNNTIKPYNTLYAYEFEAGKTYNVTGIYLQYNNTKELLPRSEDDVEEVVNEDAAVTLANYNISVAAEGGEAILTVQYQNIDEIVADIQFYEEDGVTETTADSYDWLVVELDDDNNVNYLAVANTGEERKAYFKVFALDNNSATVYSELITITQAGYVADFATLPFEYNDGRDGIGETSGLTHVGLGTDYSGNNPKLKFDNTDDYLLLKFNEEPGKLSFDIKGNNFSGGTFTVQVSEDGENFTELASYTELGNTETKEFVNLGANVRYIKWVYTEKVNGNVGLGNIKLEKPATTVTITINEGYAATTFSCDKALDFSNMEITAFIITDENGTTDEVTKVPANTGIYVEGAEGSYEVPILADETEADDVTGNKLIPTVAGETLVSNDEFTYYAYGKQKGTEAFFKISTDTAKGLNQPANKAVLAIEAAAGAKDVIFVNGDVTGIDSIDNEQPTNSRYFTVDGKLVKGQPTQKGIYIVNGRKVVIK